MPRLGLKTPFRGGTVQDLAKRVLEIARSGLKARARKDRSGEDESGFLSTLQEVADSGVTPAERLLRLYKSDWDGDIDQLFREGAY